MNKKIAIAAFSLLTAVPAMAEELKFDTSKAYVGGGLGYNDLDISGTDSALGFQFFGGYSFGDILSKKVDLAVEAGYMTSGDFEFDSYELSDDFTIRKTKAEVSADGIWANAVVSYPLQNNIALIGRIGLDFGDDDGVMFGGGAEFKLAGALAIRAEYVIRDTINSLQGNVVYRF
jgi:opacity protein-like surface antigen